jgi:class 3 adenylate cyclase
VLVSQATRALVDGELTDLGEHRLKDFSEPVWISSSVRSDSRR